MIKNQLCRSTSDILEYYFKIYGSIISKYMGVVFQNKWERIESHLPKISQSKTHNRPSPRKYISKGPASGNFKIYFHAGRTSYTLYMGADSSSGKHQYSKFVLARIIYFTSGPAVYPNCTQFKHPAWLLWTGTYFAFPAMEEGGTFPGYF